MNENEGRWVTIHGKRVFIKDKNAKKKKEIADKIFNNKEFTKKDIKAIRYKEYYSTSDDTYGNPIEAYELNGIKLMKVANYKGNGYSWQIRTDGGDFPYESFLPSYWDKIDKGEVIIPKNYKEGIERLIEEANRKGDK